MYGKIYALPYLVQNTIITNINWINNSLCVSLLAKKSVRMKLKSKSFSVIKNSIEIKNQNEKIK